METARVSVITKNLHPKGKGNGQSDERTTTTGSLLLGMGAAAKLIGVSRATFWRMIRNHVLEKVEVLPGSFRVRRSDVEAIVLAKEDRN